MKKSEADADQWTEIACSLSCVYMRGMISIRIIAALLSTTREIHTTHISINRENER